MEFALLAARLVLVAVFGTSGLAKLADRQGSQKAVVDLGGPAALAAPLGALLPVVELAVALAVLVATTAWYGALAALALLVLFTIVVAVNLARGRAPDCRCFGQIGAGPIGWETLVRNLVLVAVAAFLVLQGPTRMGPGVLSLLGALSPADRLTVIVALAAVVLVGAVIWTMALMLGQNGRILTRLDTLETLLASGAALAPSAIESAGVDGAAAGAAAPAHVGLPIGGPAPSFQLGGLRGEMLSLEALCAGELPVLLIFTDPNCGPCNALMPDIGRWQQEHADELTIAVVSRGSVDANQKKSAEHGLRNVLLQQNYEIADLYQAHGTPGAVIVQPDGTIGSSVALGAEAIRGLVARTLGTAGGPAGPVPSPEPNGHAHPAPAPRPLAAELGQPAPPVRLPDLGGQTVDLADLRGQKTLLIFWNPGCGFCQQMLPDLKAWEENPPPGAPRALIVSSGSVEANQAMGLKSPVLLDQGFSVGSAFGANGTPMAVIIDEEGKIASSVAAGAQAVLALAGASPATT